MLSLAGSNIPFSMITKFSSSMSVSDCLTELKYLLTLSDLSIVAGKKN